MGMHGQQSGPLYAAGSSSSSSSSSSMRSRQHGRWTTTLDSACCQCSCIASHSCYLANGLAMALLTPISSHSVAGKCERRIVLVAMQAPVTPAPRATADDRADDEGGLPGHGYAATASEVCAWSAKLVALARCTSSQDCCKHLSQGRTVDHKPRIEALWRLTWPEGGFQVTCPSWCWQYTPIWMQSCMQGMRPWIGKARVPCSIASEELLLLSAAMASCTHRYRRMSCSR